MSDLRLAITRETALPCAVVRMQDAFRQALDALVTARGETAVKMAEQADISNATLSRLINGSRKPSFEMLETLRSALDVAPAALFIPWQTNVDGRIVDSQWTIQAHLGVVTDPSPAIDSSLPLSRRERGAVDMQHEQDRQDFELFMALQAYWDGLDTETRYELLRVAGRLKAERADTQGKRHG